MLLQVLTTAVELVEDGLRGNRFITVTKKDIQAYVRLANLIKTNYTRLHEALRLCQTALKKIPDDFRATREMGHVLFHMQRLEEARAYLQQAIQLQPSEPNAHYLLGATLGDMGDLGGAEVSIRHAMSLVKDAGSRLAYMVHLGAVLQRKGELEEAETL